LKDKKFDFKLRDDVQVHSLDFISENYSNPNEQDYNNKQSRRKRIQDRKEYYEENDRNGSNEYNIEDDIDDYYQEDTSSINSDGINSQTDSCENDYKEEIN